MQVPLELSFRDVPKTKETEKLITEKVDKLEQVCDNLISCRVVVEKPQKHQRSGNPYRVRIDVTVPPGHEMVVTKEPGQSRMNAPLSAVIRDAFEAMLRQLKELTERQRREIKVHPQQRVNGFVSRLFKEDGYGFIQSTDGRQIYFHRNSVLGDEFDRLEVGTGVHYSEEQGDKGPQASSVSIEHKPNPPV
jgi:cold shock CspA family protein/ribosome-associated translation inhibitor RaiA